MTTDVELGDETTPDHHYSNYDRGGGSANVTRLIGQLMRGYDKRLRPNYKGLCKSLAWQFEYEQPVIAYLLRTCLFSDSCKRVTRGLQIRE